MRRVMYEFSATTVAANLSSEIFGEDNFVNANHQSSFVSGECQPNGSITLTYASDSNGNRLIDFSKVGYKNGDVELPITAGEAGATTIVNPTSTFSECMTELSDSGGYVKKATCSADDR